VQAVRSTDRGLEVILGGDAFPTGSTELAPAARSQVARVASVLSQAQRSQLLVNGHTDSTGAADSNRIISRLRAEAVRNALIESGVNPSSITVLASGEDVPLASNDTRDGRSRNRRVEVVIVDY
jgi:outer membrane protein OmpA-like peptidoglycan-associated protein